MKTGPIDEYMFLSVPGTVLLRYMSTIHISEVILELNILYYRNNRGKLYCTVTYKNTIINYKKNSYNMGGGGIFDGKNKIRTSGYYFFKI